MSIAMKPTVYEISGYRCCFWPNIEVTIERSWYRAHPMSGYHPEVPKDWDEMWKIKCGSAVLGMRKKSGGWEFERQPSSRTWAMLKRTRFPTAFDAWHHLQARAKETAI